MDIKVIEEYILKRFENKDKLLEYYKAKYNKNNNDMFLPRLMDLDLMLKNTEYKLSKFRIHRYNYLFKKLNKDHSIYNYIEYYTMKYSNSTLL